MDETEKLCVIKADGGKEEFNENKLRSSLKRSGASKDIIEDVVDEINKSSHGCITTREIYKRAYQILKRIKNNVAIQYNLRRAVMEMGPSGFSFEKFVGEILKRKGYGVKTNIFTRGWCVRYEIDVSARKDGIHHVIECKFHNKLGVKSDLKTALYVHARAADIEKKHEHDRAEESRGHQAWLVTNTKLTTEATKYCKCADVNIISWNYPKVGNLQDLILEVKVHPITALSSLSTKEKKVLMKAGYVLCSHLNQNHGALDELRLSEAKKKKVLKEVQDVCS